MRGVRITFAKTGLAKYISHLDMNRCLTRAVRRAEIPLWYTEGFNPHPYMTFLMPLPLGQEGLREPLDMKIEGEMSNSEIMSRLNGVMPQGIEIIAVKEPVRKPNEIAFASYDVTADFGSEERTQEFCRCALEIMQGGSLEAEKRSKKGARVVNLCTMVKSFSASANGSLAQINAVLAAGSTINLNCSLLMHALYEKTDIAPESESCVRTALLCENGEVFE